MRPSWCPTPDAFAPLDPRGGYDLDGDLVARHATSHHVVADGSGTREIRTPFRYTWPSELDLMARLAGLELKHRWGGWDGSPFTAESTSHVSVWRKPH